MRWQSNGWQCNNRWNQSRGNPVVQLRPERPSTQAGCWTGNRTYPNDEVCLTCCAALGGPPKVLLAIGAETDAADVAFLASSHVGDQGLRKGGNGGGGASDGEGEGGREMHGDWRCCGFGAARGFGRSGRSELVFES